jgi:adenylate cyclase
MKEIERKFEVLSDEFLKFAKSPNKIKQGYLSITDESVVRVRIKDNVAYITVKGANISITRDEFEYNIPKVDAIQMLKLCPGAISKTRYNVSWDDLIIEVDVFHGDNEGLVVAEVEFKNADQNFDKPSWLGKELTDPKYFNSSLIKLPYKDW